ncbi:sphere organelles protein-related [Forsythia ovata]|uniref:Sphere organelles protein-related n=1 Tax=Forsythia ovata TaxID=205694 RepID=A0ABD1WC09_9LAMI
METKRVRFVFKNEDILRETQKSDGLNRCWVQLKPDQHRTIADIASHLLHAFQLHQSCPHGLVLSMDGFVLPPFESTTILKDKDLIRIRKREDALFIEGHNAAHSVNKLKALEKQPGNSGVLLLSNVEFEKEKEVYESDDSEEEDKDDLLEGFENPPGVNADSKERKRKASEKLNRSMKKKQRSEAPETFASDGREEKIENPHQDGVPTKQKRLSQVEKKSDSNDKENVENNQENAKLSDGNDDSIPSMKRSLELQENGEEIKDASHAPKETKKVPSRSARRKHAKRKWLQEMAKIQKKNATSESESLRNWKEDQAKAERNKVDGQPRGVRNWKKDVGKAETKEVDGQPKGLLHWKQFPGCKMSNNMGKHQQKNQNINVHEHSNRNGNTSWHSNQYSDEEAEAVPVVVRPGHIRFGNVGKEQDVDQSQMPVETIQWNGITSKKKGQKWGTAKCSFTQINDCKDSNKECSETPNNEKETISYRGIDFDNLQPLCSMPKEGDVIAYRTLELSSSWIPELSPYRVGKVSCYNAGSGQILLITFSEFPVVSKKLDDVESTQPDNSLYKEDGSIEIDFYSLVDVRIVKGGTSGPRNVAPSLVNGSPVGNESVPITVSSSSNDKQTVVPSKENKEANNGIPTQSPAAESGGVSAWDQFAETLNTNKEQLSEENSWDNSAKTVHPTWENSWGKNANVVQPQHKNSWGKNAKKVQPPGENSWGRQNSGRKSSWSFKSSRGGARGSTMSRWKNGN